MPGATMTLREALRLCGENRLPENPIDLAEAGARTLREIARARPDLSEAAAEAEAASRLGLSPEGFRRTLALRGLGAEVRDLVADGRLSVDQALALAALPEARRQRALAREAVDHDLAPELVRLTADLMLADPRLRVGLAVRRAGRRIRPAGGGRRTT